MEGLPVLKYQVEIREDACENDGTDHKWRRDETERDNPDKEGDRGMGEDHHGLKEIL